LIDLDRLRSALSPRYEIRKEIGSGGMAHVYVARDERHERDVAIKVLRPELASLVGPGRFLREIRIEARLHHPNILPLHDSGESNGFLYYVMPYVAGESLRDRLKREKQLTLDEALHITCEIADALSYAHGHDVVHRDIKPENILLHSGHALLADFGIARAIGNAAGDRVTETGHSVGTPAYMSPEQAVGESDLDARSDIYSLGCVLYEMLAGDPPFTARTPQALIAKQIAESPPSLRVVRPSTPGHVTAAIEKALAKTPADRFARASVFKEALQTPNDRVAIYNGRRVSNRRTGISNRTLAIAGVLAASILVGGYILMSSVFINNRERILDPNRIVVFPLVVSGDREGHGSLGEDIATVCLHALGGTSPLRWLDGWLWLEHGAREDIRSLEAEHAKAITRQHGARYYIWGRSVILGDSVRVLLHVHDVEGDSVVALTESSGLAREAWRSGLRAFTRLLLTFVPVEGEHLDLTALSDTPVAVTHFLIGERHYRRSQFPRALEHFNLAVRADSSFALSALRGAQAALWNYHWVIDPAVEQLLSIAINNSMSLPAHQAHFAIGLRHRVQGRADSAVSYMVRAVATDPNSRDAWMALAGTYRFLLPNVAPLDSLAHAAYSRVV
jgi:serine/threonine-protein kinase